jgi:hypothetical protein
MPARIRSKRCELNSLFCSMRATSTSSGGGSAEDAVALPFGREPIEGWDAFCTYFDDLWKNAGLRFDLGVIQTWQRTRSATCTYVARMGDQSVPGVTHEAYRLQPDGSWKCTVDMWHNSVE